jgi:TM2 domain-containing membrane protein YozV
VKASAPTRLQWIAGVSLVVCLLAVVIALQAGSRGAHIQGPREIAAVGPDRLWLVVDDEVLVLDGSGRLVSTFQTSTLGFARSFNTITPMSAGKVLLSTRAHPEWMIADADTGKVTGRLRPQSPEGLRAIDRTYHLAVAPNGDIAMATSGDHSVLLLDSQGRQKARTRDGLFRYANSVWHTAEGWWVVDTNNHALRLLDLETLAEKTNVRLEMPHSQDVWTGQARPHPAASAERFATLSRMRNGMIVGRVVDVDRQGREQVRYALRDGAEPGALMWWRDRLIVAESRSFSVRAFRPDGTADADFGDAAVSSALQTRRTEKLALEIARWSLLALALAGLLVGVWAYWRDRSRATTSGAQATVGTPQVTQSQLLRHSIGAMRGWPGLLLAAFFAIELARPFISRGPLPGVVALLILTWGLFLWLRSLLRSFRLPENEPYANMAAMRLLRQRRMWEPHLEAGEMPQEVLTLVNRGLTWLMLTDRRLLVFKGSALDASLQQAIPRSQIAFGEISDDPGWLARLNESLLGMRPQRLALRTLTGEEIAGTVTSPHTAQRIISRLGLKSAPATAPRIGTAAVADSSSAWRNALLSLIVPGLGQLMLGRPLTAFLLVTTAGISFFFSIFPYLFALFGHRMDISPRFAAIAFASYALSALYSAYDAYAGSSKRL